MNSFNYEYPVRQQIIDGKKIIKNVIRRWNREY